MGFELRQLLVWPGARVHGGRTQQRVCHGGMPINPGAMSLSDCTNKSRLALNKPS